MDCRGGLLLVAAPYSSRTRSTICSPTCSATLCAPRSPARHRGPCQRGANARAQGSSRCASNNTFARYTPAISPEQIRAASHRKSGLAGKLENPAHVTVTRIPASAIPKAPPDLHDHNSQFTIPDHTKSTPTTVSHLKREDRTASSCLHAAPQPGEGVGREGSVGFTVCRVSRPSVVCLPDTFEKHLGVARIKRQ